MRRLIFVLLALSAISADAALTLVTREPFVGPGTLTSASPGAHFSSVTGTFTMVAVGPRTTAIAAPGWSADIRTTGGVNYRGTVNLSGAASTCGLWGAWFRFKAFPPNAGYLSVMQLLDESNNNVVMDFSFNSSGVISYSPYTNGGHAAPLTSPAIPLNTWVWLAVAWQNEGGAIYGIRCMSKTLGGTLNTWGSADGLNAGSSFFTSVNVGLQTGGSGPMMRVGCPSLYSMSSFTDVAYPADIIAPVEASYPWYVNPSTGNDANVGNSATTAWQTVAKVNAESQYCGMLDSNNTGAGNGDVLTIDTSKANLVINPTANAAPSSTQGLVLSTQGLKVQPVSGQTYIKFQAERTLLASGWTLTTGTTHTYQTTDVQPLDSAGAGCVVWENDMWMWHVKAASISASATVTNPQTSSTTSYASTTAALDAVPGSFYTDGTHLYVHPFGNTNPMTDKNMYTRSVNRGLPAPAASAVLVQGGNYSLNGFYIRKTTLVNSSDSDFGAYCIQDGVGQGSGYSNTISNCYLAYGDKHCLGLTGPTPGTTVTITNVECEQANPYSGFGSQSPFVSYGGGIATADMVHLYNNCNCLARSGLIGSTAGDPIGTGGDVILSHNNGSYMSYGSITFNSCNFASGSATMGAATNFVIKASQIAQLLTYCPNTTATQSLFTNQSESGMVVQMNTGTSSLNMQNCIVKPTWVLGGPATYYGILALGSVTLEGCTFDLSGMSGNSASYFLQGFIQRTGPLNLTFRNNVYLVPSGENLPLLYNASSSDTLTFDHNAYNLGSGTTLARNYTNGTPASLTFAQWQALGKDCANSTLNANLLLQSDVPQSGSPLFNAGVDFGSEADYTGTVYAHRDTIGAYQGSAAYRAPQTISGLPSLTTVTTNESPIKLPATTSAGLAITYTVVSGPATLSGTTLTLTGVGTVILTATQAGNSSNAPLSEVENLDVVPPSIDTPTLPTWALALLGGMLALAAARSLPRVRA